MRLIGRYVCLYPFDTDESDPGMDEVLGMDARMQAENAGYHPTDDPAAVVWHRDIVTQRWCARVVVILHETEEITT